MTVTDLWTEASRDLEAERAQLRLFEAQQRCADLWPFMALARSQEELDHRLALVRDTLDMRVPDPIMQEALLEGFTANFKIGYADDLGSDTGEGDEPPTSASGFATSGSGLQDQDGTPDVTASRHGQPVQIWHTAKQQWVTVTAVQSPTPSNPEYFAGGPEEGPNTGQTGTYPVEVGGPDPWNPINGNLPLPPTNVIPPANRFPAQPQPWTVPPDASWVDNPMNFDSGPNAHKGSVGEDLSGAQQSNPNYFGQGQVGLQSEEGASFPVDVALPEPDERVDMYQNATSGAGHGSPTPGEFAGPAVNMIIPPQYVTGARSNVAACASCGRPAYREGRKWHHLDAHLKGDHNVMLDADHPWVQQMAHSSAVQHEGRDFSEKQREDAKKKGDTLPGTDKFPIENKEDLKAAKDRIGTTNEPHDKVVKYIDRKARELGEPGVGEDKDDDKGSKKAAHFMHVADATSAGSFPAAAPSTTPMSSASPSIPPSMTQGAPGAEAMPPMSSGNQNTPMPPATGTLHPRVASFFHVAEGDIRERPTQFNPTGAGDEYQANTWENQIKQSPRQDAAQRGVNTPQVPSGRIPQISSTDNPGQNESSAQDDGEDED